MFLVQVVTTVPSKVMPPYTKTKRNAAGEIEMQPLRREEEEEVDILGTDDMGRRGQILWIRGLTRLQHQVSRTPSPNSVPPPEMCPIFSVLPLPSPCCCCFGTSVASRHVLSVTSSSCVCFQRISLFLRVQLCVFVYTCMSLRTLLLCTCTYCLVYLYVLSCIALSISFKFVFLVSRPRYITRVFC